MKALTSRKDIEDELIRTEKRAAQLEQELQFWHKNKGLLFRYPIELAPTEGNGVGSSSERLGAPSGLHMHALTPRTYVGQPAATSRKHMSDYLDDLRLLDPQIEEVCDKTAKMADRILEGKTISEKVRSFLQ